MRNCVCVCPVCIYFALFATKLGSCYKPKQPSSLADIQSGCVIVVAAVISWPGDTWMSRRSAADNAPGGLGCKRWLTEQLHKYMSLWFTPFIKSHPFVPLIYKNCFCILKNCTFAAHIHEAHVLHLIWRHHIKLNSNFQHLSFMTFEYLNFSQVTYLISFCDSIARTLALDQYHIFHLWNSFQQK